MARTPFKVSGKYEYKISPMFKEHPPKTVRLDLPTYAKKMHKFQKDTNYLKSVVTTTKISEPVLSPELDHPQIKLDLIKVSIKTQQGVVGPASYDPDYDSISKRQNLPTTKEGMRTALGLSPKKVASGGVDLISVYSAKTDQDSTV